MPPWTPQLPSTFEVDGHILQLTYVPNHPAVRTWRVTEQLGAVTVGYEPLQYDNGEFTLATSTGVVRDAGWAWVLRRAFGR